jgi:hypothetical protein
MNEKPFWNFLINLSVVKWFCNLKISKDCMKLKLFQKIFFQENPFFIEFHLNLLV